MTAVDGLPPLRDVIRDLSLSARKMLSQNFILDLNLTRRIARAAGPLEGVTVLEVGPGPGGLTRALFMEGAEKVVAIERDERCRPALQQIAERYPGRLDVHVADALELDPAQAIAGPFRIVANLPYSVATPLLVGWLTAEPWPPAFDRMVLMFQREVADRIVAEPGGKSYGRLSVLAQWRTETRIVQHVPARAFTPPPKVASAVVELVPKPAPRPDCPAWALETVTSAAFGQRRKMLRSSLRQATPQPEALLEPLGIPATLRAEQLSVEQFCTIAQALAARG
ncbi:MAG: 16S rRNA (adenine(1518)-N(6)/adenine(1519)-N(6))-dimethyltransferase RsmA [Hyphomicrobiales bacterium]|nr:16S rRNA (adenine(1518)-N(6)/adenine(1519)-N(6))-dimethyltransferase RsmA [Hyphomicrobiales bacterium]